MTKKLIMLAMAVGAFIAFAAPAAANAQTLTEGGNPLALGATVRGTSSNTKTVVPALGAELTCTNVTIDSEVLTNEPTESSAAGPATATGCLVNGALPATVTSAEAVINLTGPGVGAVELEFVVDIGELNCTFAGAGTASYVTNSDEVSVEAELSGNCGEATLTGTYTLETGNGTPVTID